MTPLSERTVRGNGPVTVIPIVRRFSWIQNQVVVTLVNESKASGRMVPVGDTRNEFVPGQQSLIRYDGVRRRIKALPNGLRTRIEDNKVARYLLSASASRSRLSIRDHS
ncbi:hypothetical protein H6P81_000587 [Aristolochia fimbriata]|uniref:Uncharacterized protein n=1 Tax=Aristolochia fimbriata TaxID=158543 RepID=A0AAV7F5X9_ARIFI|nr:hypothetical protein H6P81_000587 [Aristolochia fimbriata]